MVPLYFTPYKLPLFRVHSTVYALPASQLLPLYLLEATLRCLIERQAFAFASFWPRNEKLIVTRDLLLLVTGRKLAKAERRGATFGESWRWDKLWVSAVSVCFKGFIHIVTQFGPNLLRKPVSHQTHTICNVAELCILYILQPKPIFKSKEWLRWKGEFSEITVASTSKIQVLYSCIWFRLFESTQCFTVCGITNHLRVNLKVSGWTNLVCQTFNDVTAQSANNDVIAVQSAAQCLYPGSENVGK